MPDENPQTRPRRKEYHRRARDQLQVRGVDISVPALSLLEGQKRPVTDIELNALADIFGVTADLLLGRNEPE